MSSYPTVPSGAAPVLARTLRWALILSVLLTVAGVVAVILPVISGLAITLVVGWMLCLVGILHFVFAWKSHRTSSVLWELLVGFLYLVGGVYLIAHPIAGLASLTLFLAIYLLFRGGLEILQFFQFQPRHGSGWLLFNGILNLVLAVLIWRSWPGSSAWAVGTLIGLSMLFTGISRLMLTIAAQRALRHA